MTGDADNVAEMDRLVQPAKVSGFARRAVRNNCVAALVRDDSEVSVVDGILIVPSDPQREMLDEIEGEDSYEVVEVDAVTDSGEIVNADTYLWRDRHMDLILPDSSWELEVFVKEHLQSWLDLMTDDGIEDNADISSL
ncbi:hypothetical protein AX16_003434 [Volvariella volvacea WC 439]|nr:hypothetical protein AX16_003434 [Volvariella volvacea WC 439]